MRRVKRTQPLGLKSKSRQFRKGKLKGLLGGEVEVGDKVEIRDKVEIGDKGLQRKGKNLGIFIILSFSCPTH